MHGEHRVSKEIGQPQCKPGAPKRKLKLAGIKRSLCPVERKKVGVLFFSWIKDGKTGLGSSRVLPHLVEAGLRIPWVSQDCPLCKYPMSTRKDMIEHMRKTHSSQGILLICAKCSCTYLQTGNSPLPQVWGQSVWAGWEC